MATIDPIFVPLKALLHREVARFMKVATQTVITPFVSSSLYLMIFGVSLGQRISFKEDLPYLAFLIPGLVTMGCLNNAFQNTSSSIIAAKFGGELEDLKAAPVANWQILTAMGLGALIRGFMVAAITWLMGEVAYYLVFGEFLKVEHWPALILFLALGGFVFANIGIAVGFWARTFDQMSAVGGFILLPLIYLGGVFFSIDHLPPFWRSVAMANPLLYMINGVRYGILGQSDVDWLTALMVTTVAVIATSLLALLSLKKGSFHRW